MNKNKELIKTLHKEYKWQRIEIGESGAETHYLTAINRPSIYLKTAPVKFSLNLENESKVLEWLKGKLPVPELLAFFIEDEKEYLIMSESSGINMAQLVDGTTNKAMVKSLAAGLKRIHTVSMDNCPFNHTISREIAIIKDRLKNNLIDESDFDELRLGRKASDLFEELISKIPQKEDLVFTHGDYSLPNIIVNAYWEISGFIDLGRAGIGDRYRDLALACRSIEYNCGKEWVTLFIDEYGLKKIDNEKIEFYKLVDEFF
jgi:aminoglycoside phosphotransferase